MDWTIEAKELETDKITENGNRFLIGNGYMGVRGTLDEYGKEYLPAINLAGIYDRVGDGWREPLNAPNGYFLLLRVDGKVYRLPECGAKEHLMTLDYRHGIVTRKTTWMTEKGEVSLASERLASIENVHLLAERIWICADFRADIEIISGIDGDVWDIHGPHYDELHPGADGNRIRIQAVTHEKKDKVLVAAAHHAAFSCSKDNEKKALGIHRIFRFVSEPQKIYQMDKGIAVYTSRDTEEYELCAENLLTHFEAVGYDKIRQKHIQLWEDRWRFSEIEIEGSEEAMQAVNYSIYHLHCIAPRHADSLSIPARGLSGQTYKGAVFWDTEMFMLDFFLNTEPDVAKSLLKYRIDTLEGALEKARSYGYEGAFYAWESQEGGYDACTDYNVTDVFTGRPMRTYFKDKQVHISAAIVYGLKRYIDRTGDVTILEEGGAEVIIECARFYYSLLLKKVDGDCYEIHDVIGPDEYHERVNNNGYTNRMAKLCFDEACEALESVTKLQKEYPVEKLLEQFKDASKHIYIPKPESDGIIEQFDGYRELEDVTIEEVRSRLLHEKEYWGGAYGVASQTQVIKQADVVTLLSLFGDDYEEECWWKNWEYYEPRTEHGSSLSACMYALLACKCHKSEKAYPFFLKSALADLKGGGKEWAGLVYIGGTHPAAAGGAYMTVVNGFAGVTTENQSIKINPNLPAEWKRLRFHMCYRGDIYCIDIRGQNAELIKRKAAP